MVGSNRLCWSLGRVVDGYTHMIGYGTVRMMGRTVSWQEEQEYAKTEFEQKTEWRDSRTVVHGCEKIQTRRSERIRNMNHRLG